MKQPAIAYKNLCLQLSVDLYDKVTGEAYDMRISRGEFVRRAVNEYFAKLEQEKSTQD